MTKRYKGFRKANAGKNVAKKYKKKFSPKSPSKYLSRETENVESLDTKVTGPCNWKNSEDMSDAKKIGLAPAYNKGAYQPVFNLEDAKNVGK